MFLEIHYIYCIILVSIGYKHMPVKRREMVMRSIIALLFVFLAAFAVLAGERQDKTITAKVTAVDLARSTITVRFLNPLTGKMDELILGVTEEAELIRGPYAISTADIKQGDPVEVTYYQDDLSGLKVRRLVDMHDADS